MKKLLLLSLISCSNLIHPITSTEIVSGVGIGSGLIGCLYTALQKNSLSAQSQFIIERLKADAMNDAQRARQYKALAKKIKRAQSIPFISKRLIAYYTAYQDLYIAPKLTQQERSELGRKYKKICALNDQYSLMFSGWSMVGLASFGNLMNLWEIQRQELEAFTQACTTLGLNPTVSDNQARATHKNLVLAHAPDKTGNDLPEARQRYQAINAAWNTFQAYRRQHPLAQVPAPTVLVPPTPTAADELD